MDKINKLIEEKYNNFNMTHQANEIRENYKIKPRNFFSFFDDIESDETIKILIMFIFFLGLFFFMLFSKKGDSDLLILAKLMAGFFSSLFIVLPSISFSDMFFRKIYKVFNKEKSQEKEKQKIIDLSKKADEACYTSFLKKQIDNDILNFLKIDLSHVEYNIFSVSYPSRTYEDVLQFYKKLPNTQKQIEESNQEKISLALTKEDIKRFSIV